MTVDGVMKFLEDLNLNPESRTVLLVAWKFKAATQCEFTKEEFINGMLDLGYHIKFSASVFANLGLNNSPIPLSNFPPISEKQNHLKVKIQKTKQKR